MDVHLHPPLSLAAKRGALCERSHFGDLLAVNVHARPRQRPLRRRPQMPQHDPTQRDNPRVLDEPVGCIQEMWVHARRERIQQRHIDSCHLHIWVRRLQKELHEEKQDCDNSKRAHDGLPIQLSYPLQPLHHRPNGRHALGERGVEQLQSDLVPVDTLFRAVGPLAVRIVVHALRLLFRGFVRLAIHPRGTKRHPCEQEAECPDAKPQHVWCRHPFPLVE
mmetsp:Transcript_61052/g.175139  ORF Transcript_61052/g.175139 Transcript_61052/m.175139 type:complete len:220 (-) Transcript_61052:35-694(-)